MATTHQNQDFSQNYYPNYPQYPANYYGQYYNQNNSYMDNGNFNQNNYQQSMQYRNTSEQYQHLHNSMNSYGYNTHHQSYNGYDTNLYHQNSGIEQQNELNKNLIVPQAVPVQEEVKKETRKRKNISESSNDDSPALRFLLTNPQKKLKYTPSYSIHGFTNTTPSPVTRELEVTKNEQSIVTPYQDKIFNEFLDRSPYCERDSPHSTDFYKPVSMKKSPETILLSPNRTEDSLDFNEFTPKMQSHSVKDGYESMPQQFYNNISGMQSATGVGTPPLSPKEAGPLNGDKSAMSSPTSLNYNWMNGCESGNFVYLIYFLKQFF